MTMTPIKATIPFRVGDVATVATFVYDPNRSIDAIEVTFPEGKTWTVLIDFFMRSNNWGGDIKSIVTSHTVTIILVSPIDGSHHNLLFDGNKIAAFLEQCHTYIEDNEIVLPWQREWEVEREIHTLYI